MAKLAPGTLARIAAVLERDEERTAFLREAVERQIERRERSVPTPRKRPRKGRE
jgi:hypothetical protein